MTRLKRISVYLGLFVLFTTGFTLYDLQQRYSIYIVPKSFWTNYSELLDYDSSDKIKRLKFPVVKIKYPNSGGTGVCIKTFSLMDGTKISYILTNKHIADSIKNRDEGYAQIEIYDGKRYLAKVFAVSDQFDLALLEMYGIELPIAKISQIESKPLDEVLVLGFPQLQFAITKGIVTGIVKNVLGYKSLQISAGVWGGSSGSPVYNEKEEIVGLVFASNRRVSFFSYAVPLESIKKFLNRYEPVIILYPDHKLIPINEAL